MMRSLQGQPGNGKTRLLVRKLIHQLRLWRHDPRPIGINFGEELILPRLNEYLHELDGDEAPDVHSRLILIPKDQTQNFFRYRAGGLVLPEPPERDSRTDKKLPYDEFRDLMRKYFEPMWQNEATAEGVIYMTDEAHDFWSAREWMNCGRSALYYASKHRHLRDDWWWASQAPEQVEATLKRLTSEFFEVRNQYRESMGFFRKPGKFVVRCYYKMPTSSEKPFDEYDFKLDPKGEASCYKTTGVLGNKNGQPEHIERSKKLPFWVLPVAVVAAIWALGSFIMGLPAMTEKGMTAIFGGVAKGAAKVSPKGPPSLLPSAVAAVPPAAGVQRAGGGAEMPAKPAPVAPVREFSGVLVRSSARLGNRLNVMLTNGIVVTERGPGAENHPWDVVADDRGYITLRSGERIYKQQHLPVAAAARGAVVEAGPKVEEKKPELQPVAPYKEALFDPSPELSQLGGRNAKAR